jgi:hypothetical protein
MATILGPRSGVGYKRWLGRRVVTPMTNGDSLPRLSTEIRGHVAGDPRKLILHER